VGTLFLMIMETCVSALRDSCKYYQDRAGYVLEREGRRKQCTCGEVMVRMVLRWWERTPCGESALRLKPRAMQYEVRLRGLSLP
jgi:hypothetical protein